MSYSQSLWEESVESIKSTTEYSQGVNTNYSSTIGLKGIFSSSLIDLATPPNLSAWYNFGSLLGLVLGIQLTTGIFLAMHYACDADLAFDSVSSIIRDVVGGWFIRGLHVNSASLIFFCLYAHIGRGIYYGSYTFKGVWFVGLFLLSLVMAAAFLGYVLPWGQISYWGATVITNLFSAIPYVGSTIVYWVWGGFSVGNPTLTRFFALHFLIPFLVSGMSMLHIFYLHLSGSSNPLGVTSDQDKVAFHWYYTSKDVFGFCLVLSSLLFLVFFYPLLLLESDNFIPSNPLVTPSHIVPEWYFLFAYSILRCVPSKLGGVFALFSSIFVLAVLPFSHSQLMKGLSFYGPVNGLFWGHVTVFILLTLGGSWPVEAPYTVLSRIFSAIYFSFYALLWLYRYTWDLVLS